MIKGLEHVSRGKTEGAGTVYVGEAWGREAEIYP